MADSGTIPPPPPKVEGPGLFDDLLEIFTSPAKVFARRATSGGGAIFFFVVIALGAILYSGKSVMEPIMDAQMARAQAQAMKNNPNITAEQLQAGQAMQKKLMPVFMVLGVPIALLGLGLIVWLVGKAFGATLTFGASIMVASFAYVPRIIGGVITDIHGLMLSDTSHLVNPAQLSLSPARFMDPVASNQVLLAALARVDLITIWVTVLIGIGYAAAGKLGKEKAIAAAVVIWLLGGIFPIWGAISGG